MPVASAVLSAKRFRAMPIAGPVGMPVAAAILQFGDRRVPHTDSAFLPHALPGALPVAFRAVSDTASASVPVLCAEPVRAFAATAPLPTYAVATALFHVAVLPDGDWLPVAVPAVYPSANHRQ